MRQLWLHHIECEALGGLDLVCDDEMLVALEFRDCRARMRAGLRVRFGDFELLTPVAEIPVLDAVQAYLGGELGALGDIPVEPGGTPIQREVWTALRGILPGETSTYAVLATAIGRPAAVRAVGAANARNPIALVIPCHRVLGADGSLTGYAGGLDRKRWLLEHEGAIQPGLPGF